MDPLHLQRTSEYQGRGHLSCTEERPRTQSRTEPSPSCEFSSSIAAQRAVDPLTAICSECGQTTDVILTIKYGWLCPGCLFGLVQTGRLSAVDPNREFECYNCGDSTSKAYCASCTECSESGCDWIADKCENHAETRWCDNCGDDDASLCWSCSSQACENCGEEADCHLCYRHVHTCDGCDEDDRLLCRTCADEEWQLTPIHPDAIVGDDGTMTLGDTEVLWN